MKKYLLLLPVLSCFAVFPPLPAAAREEAAAEHFPQNSSIVDIFMGGGDFLKIDVREQSGLPVLRITPVGGDDFISTRLH